MSNGNLGKNSKYRTLSQLQQNIASELAHKPFTGKTDEAIAIEYGIARTTIWRWKELKEFNDLVLDISKEIQRAHLPDFNHALLKCLGSSNEKSVLKAIELYYKNQGLLKDVQEATIKEEKIITIDDILKEVEGL